MASTIHDPILNAKAFEWSININTMEQFLKSKDTPQEIIDETILNMRTDMDRELDNIRNKD